MALLTKSNGIIWLYKKNILPLHSLFGQPIAGIR